MNDSAVEILSLCDRPITVSSIVDIVAKQYPLGNRAAVEKDTIEFLDKLLEQVLIQVVES